MLAPTPHGTCAADYKHPAGDPGLLARAAGGLPPAVREQAREVKALQTAAQATRGGGAAMEVFVKDTSLPAPRGRARTKHALSRCGRGAVAAGLKSCRNQDESGPDSLREERLFPFFLFRV